MKKPTSEQVKGLDIIRVSIARETLEEILKNHLVDFEGKYFTHITLR